MTRKLTATAAIAVAILALVAAGCGGGNSTTTTTGDTPADEWANGFCTAITTWKDAVTQVGNSLMSLSSLNRQALDDAAGELQTATQQLATDLGNLGTPETTSGQAVKDSIDEFVTTLDREVTDIQDTVHGVSGPAGIPSAVASVTASLSSMTTAFQSTYSTIQGADAQGELKDALDASPACDGITS